MSSANTFGTRTTVRGAAPPFQMYSLKALEGLSGRISAAQMQEMNYAADAQHENPADIARRFLDRARQR